MGGDARAGRFSRGLEMWRWLRQYLGGPSVPSLITAIVERQGADGSRVNYVYDGDFKAPAARAYPSIAALSADLERAIREQYGRLELTAPELPGVQLAIYPWGETGDVYDLAAGPRLAVASSTGGARVEAPSIDDLPAALEGAGVHAGTLAWNRTFDGRDFVAQVRPPPS